MDITKQKDTICALYRRTFCKEPQEILPIAAAGSDRRYYLVSGEGGKAVGTWGADTDENRAFIYLARHFGAKGLPVPEIFGVTDDFTTYLQSYAGGTSLFDRFARTRETGEYTPQDLSLADEAMRILARIQHIGAENLDFALCYPQEAMDLNMVRWDLNYFKYCFVKPQGVLFNELRLQGDFDRLEQLLLQGEQQWRTFMYRDYQSRNLQLSDNDSRLTAIDFQGGRRGPAEYDVASFLWQAKAAYPAGVKARLIDVYCREASAVDPGFDIADFRRRLPMFVLFREMQTLGAYGFRGTIERKTHFLQSLAAGIANFRRLFTEEYPELAHEFTEIASIAAGLLIPRDAAPAAGGPLTVTVQSFSYRKGYPEDLSGNGGGFIFDCRSVHNPGRYDQYKPLTGMDAPVREFLEKDGEIFPFLENAEALVSAAVRKYIRRGFTSLSVCFGCTGGRHRSVYSAHAMAEYLRREFPEIIVREIHREQPQLCKQ